MAIRIDARLEDRNERSELGLHLSGIITCGGGSHRPLDPRGHDGDRSRVSREEKNQGVLLLWWGWSLRLELPGKRALVERGSLVGVFQLESSNRKRTCLPVTLEWPGEARKTSALLDSGAEESFLDSTTAACWGVPFNSIYSIQFYLYSAFYNTGLSQSSFTKGPGLRPPQSKPRATVARKNSLTSRKKPWAEPGFGGGANLLQAGTGQI